MPVFFKDLEGQNLEDVIKTQKFVDDTNRSQLFYVLTMNREPGVVKFGISQDMTSNPGNTSNSNKTRFQKYINQFGYNNTRAGLGVKIHYLYQTKYRSGKFVGRTRITATENEMKNAYKTKGLLTRGSERVTQTPKQVIEDFTNYFGYTSRPETPAKRSQRLKDSSSAAAAAGGGGGARRKRTKTSSTASAAAGGGGGGAAATYDVEAFMDERLYRKQTQYLVKWKGYERPTWEYANPLKKDLGELFNQLVAAMKSKAAAAPAPAPAPAPAAAQINVTPPVVDEQSMFDSVMVTPNNILQDMPRNIAREQQDVSEGEGNLEYYVLSPHQKSISLVDVMGEREKEGRIQLKIRFHVDEWASFKEWDEISWEFKYKIIELMGEEALNKVMNKQQEVKAKAKPPPKAKAKPPPKVKEGVLSHYASSSEDFERIPLVIMGKRQKQGRLQLKVQFQPYANMELIVVSWEFKDDIVRELGQDTLDDAMKQKK
jgi:hypothetical protein